MKETRWYWVDRDGMARVSNAPSERQADFVSIVSVSDIAYYRRTFRLIKGTP